MSKRPPVRMVCLSALEEALYPIPSVRLLRAGNMRLAAGTSRVTAEATLRNQLEYPRGMWRKLGRESDGGTVLSSYAPLGKFVAGVNPLPNDEYELFAGRVVNSVPVLSRPGGNIQYSIELEQDHGRLRKVVFAPGVSELTVLVSPQRFDEGATYTVNVMNEAQSAEILNSPLASGFLPRHLRPALADFFYQRSLAILTLLGALDDTWEPLGRPFPSERTLLNQAASLIGRTVLGVVDNAYTQVFVLGGKVTELQDRNTTDEGIPDWWCKLDIYSGRNLVPGTLNLSGASFLYGKKL